MLGLATLPACSCAGCDAALTGEQTTKRWPKDNHRIRMLDLEMPVSCCICGAGSRGARLCVFVCVGGCPMDSCRGAIAQTNVPGQLRKPVRPNNFKWAVASCSACACCPGRCPLIVASNLSCTACVPPSNEYGWTRWRDDDGSSLLTGARWCRKGPASTGVAPAHNFDNRDQLVPLLYAPTNPATYSALLFLGSNITQLSLATQKSTGCSSAVPLAVRYLELGLRFQRPVTARLLGVSIHNH